VIFALHFVNTRVEIVDVILAGSFCRPAIRNDSRTILCGGESYFKIGNKMATANYSSQTYGFLSAAIRPDGDAFTIEGIK